MRNAVLLRFVEWTSIWCSLFKLRVWFTITIPNKWAVSDPLWSTLVKGQYPCYLHRLWHKENNHFCFRLTKVHLISDKGISWKCSKRWILNVLGGGGGARVGRNNRRIYFHSETAPESTDKFKESIVVYINILLHVYWNTRVVIFLVWSTVCSENNNNKKNLSKTDAVHSIHGHTK